MERLRSLLISFNRLTSAEIDLILDHYYQLSLDPGDYFLKAGKVSDRIGFITQGIVRMLSLNDEGEEITKHFMAEGEFTVDIDSFSNQKMSSHYLQAITACKMLAISKSSVDELGLRVPNLINIFHSISEASLLKKIKDQNIHREGTAVQKYELFVENNQEIALRVPLQYIASYLNITPQSLSRIRKQVP
ncbi:MAG: Crp/Fnr family transcriptional regulator [Bacteroidetes bacterium]|nr:Crp/Fnr family transcriptional regulator [Bacteroidota bacterium]